MGQTEIRVTEHKSSFQHELLRDDKAISGLWVVDLVLRIGIAEVPMGGIAGVWTDSAHRMQGHSRYVLENSNRWMTDHGFDCATLFGIPDYYHRFGYAVCMPQVTWEIKTRDAERASRRLTVRPFESSDLPAVRAIYAENNADRTGSIVRGEKTSWFAKGTRHGIPADAFVFLDERGEIVAYAARDKGDEKVTITEIGTRRLETLDDILRWAADRAVELRVENITLLLPPDDLFGAYITQFGVRQTGNFSRNAGAMGRILRLEPFLTKTLPEWTRRAGQAAHPGESVRLETDIGNVTLRRTDTEVTLDTSGDAAGVVRLPQSRLMQLALGYFGSEMACQLPDVQADGDLTLFHTLFPRRLPYMWTGDHF